MKWIWSVTFVSEVDRNSYVFWSVLSADAVLASQSGPEQERASRREQVGARNNVARAESALISEEAREDEEARATVLAGSSSVRNPERSALAESGPGQ